MRSNQTDWKAVTLGQVTVERDSRSELNDQYPPMTSSRSGLVLQSEYFTKKVTSSDNSGYKIISPKQFTFRSMSDDGTFKFNQSKFSFSGIVSPAYEVFEANDCDSTYLDQFLNSEMFARLVYAHSQGSTRLALKYKNLSQVEFLIPSLREQQKIAEILTSVDEVIENTQSQINKLEDLKKATMNELLTRGIGHTEFKDTEIGRIPEAWNVKTLGSVTEKISDRDHTTPIYVDADCGVPIISPKDITDDMELDLSNIKYITKDAHLKNRKKTDLRPRDIIFSRIGAGLGKSVLLTEEFFDFSILHSLCLIRPNETLLDSEYLLWQLRDSGFQRRLTLGIQSIGVPDLGLKEIGHLKVAIPSDPLEQSEISQILNRMVQRKCYLKSRHHKFVQLKHSLMQDFLTGKVRVTVN